MRDGIVGIADTHSDFNPCHGNVPKIVEAVKRGVLLAGALPMVFPTISLHEAFSHPTSMLLRNLMAMDSEEMIRAQPMDSVVLVGGCDKTLPAQMMGAISAGKPAIVIPVGPMIVGHHKGEVLGACTDCRRLWGSFRAGKIDAAEIEAVSGRLAPSAGTCMVMGTASTMALITEALGLALPGSAAVPSVHAERLRLAESAGRLAADMAVAGGPRPARSSPRVRSAMPWSCCSRSAARPTGSSICRPSRLGPAIPSTSTSSTSSGAGSLCWSTSSPRGASTWSISTRPAACRG
jgi:dihydroxy-acid dehydratase